MKRCKFITAILALAGMFGAASDARAEFVILDYDVVYDPATGILDFAFLFNRPLDAPVPSVSYDTQPTWFSFDSDNYADGPESAFAFRATSAESVPAGDVGFDSSGPLAGASVPYTQVDMAGGTLLTFAIGFSYILLEFEADATDFTYTVTSGEYGDQQFYAADRIRVASTVPEPATLAMLGMAAPAIGVLTWRSRRHRRTTAPASVE